MKTSTPINACDVAIVLADDSGSDQDISGSSNEVEISLEQTLGEYNVFGDRWAGRMACGKNGSVSMQVVYTSAADEAFDLLKQWYFATTPGTRALSIYIPDKNVGSDHFSGNFHLASLSWTSSRGEAGPIMVSAELQPDGEISHSTSST
jgi:hypothetical protein